MKKGFSLGKRQQIYLAMLLTALHILGSVFYEPILFGFAAKEALLSGSLGMVATLIASKTIGALLIWLFWRSLVRLFCGEFAKSAVVSFFALFVISLAVLALLYPENYAYEPDNLLIYREALLYDPAYWHHYLTGSFFAGCYMLLPHPVSLMLVQSSLFCALIASVFSNLAARFGVRRAWPAFLLLLVPVSFYVQYSPYRNCLYTILCMFACAELLFLWLDGKTPSPGRMIRLALAFALIAVWRSEGMLLFVLLPLGLWLACKTNLKNVLLLTAASAVFAGVLILPQSIGMKQAGNSGNYKIISTMNVLQDIYNADDFTLDYQQGEADAAVIEQFVPRAYLAEYGLAGYRAYNAANGRGINDCGKTEVEIDAFLSSYLRITLHNIPALIRSQGNRCLDALKFPMLFSVNEYSGVHNELPESTRISTASNIQADTTAYLTNGAFWRAGQGTRAAQTEQALRDNLGNWIYLYDAKTRRVSIIVRALLPFAALAVVWISGRRRKSLFPAILLLVLAAEFGAVALMAPEARTAYYYPVLFCTYLVVIILAPACLNERKTTPKPDETQI